MSQKEEPGTGPQQPPARPGDLWEDDVDEPVGEVTAASESVEVLADLVSDPARAAVVAERLAALGGAEIADSGYVPHGWPPGTRSLVRCVRVDAHKLGKDPAPTGVAPFRPPSSVSSPTRFPSTSGSRRGVGTRTDPRGMREISREAPGRNEARRGS